MIGESHETRVSELLAPLRKLEPAKLPGQRDPRRPSSLLGSAHRRLILGATAVSVAGICTVGLVLATGSAPSTHTRSARPARAGTKGIRLDGRRVTLPAGYKFTSGQSCPQAAPPPAPGQPMTVLQSFQAAAASSGGCLQAELVQGTSVVPAGATPVQVGNTTGYELTASASSVTLYVLVPGTPTDRYLVLTATALSPARLVAVAATGFSD